IRQYSQAISLAPSVVNPKEYGGQSALEELPLNYGNRSAVYFNLGLYQFALDDIDAAISHNYGRYKPEFKLITRKCECLARLGRVDEAKTVLETAKRANNLDSSDVARLNQLDKLVRTSK